MINYLTLFRIDKVINIGIKYIGLGLSKLI